MLKKSFRGGEKILSSVLDNVQYRNEIIKNCRIIKYIYKTIFLQNLLVNYTNYYLYKLISINILQTSAVAMA